MAKRPRFYDGGFYHIYNRGVEKRKIFMNEKDHLRFIHDLYEFNDADASLNSTFYYQKYRGPTSIVKKKRRKLLVDIVAYAMMPNHYHLLVRQRREKGVSLFIQKLGGGYTGYFNAKYERSGVLFQGKYKVKSVDEDRYLRHLVSYIHLNPVELFSPGWKEKGIINPAKTLSRLEEYRWSSYRDYIGEKNFPSVLNLDLAHDLALPIGGRQREALRGWFQGRQGREESIRDFIIE